jgi:4-hydroxy-tetrahydrodipicolinate synthase
MKAQYICPAVTIFHEDGNIDREGNGKLYDFLINSGISGILVMGSAGEFFGMAVEQRKELMKFAVEYLSGRTKVLVGTGCMSLSDTIELSNYALQLGADGVMVVGPYYINLSPESIEEYYDKAADGINGKLYLYNYPDRTGYDLSPTMTQSLLRKHSNIAGYKDTVPSMAHTREILNATLAEFPDFEVYCGYDENFAHNVLSGGAGCIGALSNLVPEVCSKWVAAFESNDLLEASQIQKYINRLMEFYSICIPFMPAMKRALCKRGISVSRSCSYPLLELMPHQELQLGRLMKELNIIMP